jgi:hypothetical protein
MNTAHEQTPEQQGGSGPEQREQRKAPGRPFQAGDPRINRAGRPRKDAEEQAEVVAAGTVDVLAEMEALLSRPSADDRTDFQRKLRRQYDQDFDGFMDRLVRLKGKAGGKPAEGRCPECARRKEEAEKPDEGTERVLALCDDILRRCNVEMHISREIGKRWFDLTMEQRVAILEMTGVPHTFEVNPGRPGEPTLSVLTRYGGRVDGARCPPGWKESEGD